MRKRHNRWPKDQQNTVGFEGLKQICRIPGAPNGWIINRPWTDSLITQDAKASVSYLSQAGFGQQWITHGSTLSRTPVYHAALIRAGRVWTADLPYFMFCVNTALAIRFVSPVYLFGLASTDWL